MKLKDVTTWKESYNQPRQHIKKQRHYFANKGPSSQSYGFSSSRAVHGNQGSAWESGQISSMPLCVLGFRTHVQGQEVGI